MRYVNSNWHGIDLSKGWRLRPGRDSEPQEMNGICLDYQSPDGDDSWCLCLETFTSPAIRDAALRRLYEIEDSGAAVCYYEELLEASTGAGAEAYHGE